MDGKDKGDMEWLVVPNILYILSVALPALWRIVTEAIFDVRESDNFPRNFETDFTI